MPLSLAGISVLVGTHPSTARLVSGRSRASSELYVCPGGVLLAASAAFMSFLREALVVAVCWGDAAGVSESGRAFFLLGDTGVTMHMVVNCVY